MEKKYKKYIGIAVICLVAGLFIGQSLIAKQTMLAKSFNKLLEADTYHVKADLDMDLALTPEEEEKKSFTSTNVTVEGDVMYNEDSGPELAGKLYMESKGRGNILFVDGDALILGDQVAFRLDNLPALMNNSRALVNKCTYVDASLLNTNNKEAVKESFRLVMQDMEYVGKEKLEGEGMYHFSGIISPENKEKLLDVTHKDTSGNQALHVLTRLLRHNEVKSLDIWVDSNNQELSLVRVQFARSLSEDSEADFATLNLSFSDYGKKVTIDRPEKELTVQPQVFSKLFGEGRMELQAANNQN